MHRTGFASAVCVLLAVFCIAPPGGAAEALSLVPDDAVVVISVPGIDAFTDAAGLFADAVAPGSSANLSDEISKIYTFDTGVRDGLDGAAPAALFLLMIEKAGAAEEPVIAGDPEQAPVKAEIEPAPLAGLEPSLVMVLPLADEATWRSAMGERLGKGEGENYEHIEGGFGPEAHFTVRDGFLVAAEDAAALDAWAGAASLGLSQARAGRIEDAVSRVPLAIEVSIETLLRIRPEVLEMLDADALPPGAAAQAGPQKLMLEIYMNMIRDAARDLETLLVEINPSVSGIALALNCQAAEGSLFGDFFAAQGPADLSSLDEIPDGAFIFGAGGFNAGPLMEYLMDLNREIVGAVAEEASQEEMTSALEDYDSIIRDAERLGLFQNVSFAMMKGETTALEILATYDTPEPAAAVEMLTAAMQSVYGNPVGLKMGAFSGLAPQPPEIGEETIAGRKVAVITQKLGGQEADEQAVKAVKAIYGDPMTTRVGAGDGRMIVTVGGDGALMRMMLEGSQPRYSTDVAARSLSTLAADASGVMLLSVPDMMMLGMSIAAAVNESGAQLPPLQLPPAMKLVGAAASFDGPAARMELNVPIEQINAAKMAFMQAMMMQMQQGQGGMPPGGMPPGQGGPPAPWQPEAE